jgi:hypothetical protein
MVQIHRLRYQLGLLQQLSAHFPVGPVNRKSKRQSTQNHSCGHQDNGSVAPIQVVHRGASISENGT